jgi:Zn ribbon nucleic-acid-binding protein
MQHPLAPKSQLEGMQIIKQVVDPRRNKVQCSERLRCGFKKMDKKRKEKKREKNKNKHQNEQKPQISTPQSHRYPNLKVK